MRHADQPVELLGEKRRLPGDPRGRHLPAGRDRVLLFIGADQPLDPRLVGDRVVVDERDHVTGRDCCTPVPTLQQPHVLVVALDDHVLAVAVVVDDLLVHLGRPVDDHDELDVVVRLREDAVGGLAEVLVHVERVRTDDDRDLHEGILPDRSA